MADVVLRGAKAVDGSGARATRVEHALVLALFGAYLAGLLLWLGLGLLPAATAHIHQLRLYCAHLAPPAAVRVLIVDDQRPFLRAATAMVSQMEGYEVVGAAASGEEGVAMAGALQPELVLMDVRLPGIDGAEATRRILSAQPGTVVLLASTYRAADLPADLADCGAAGFLRKEEIGEEVNAALCPRPGGVR